jgi:putative membrane protein insertion efficiency factor
MARQEKRTYSWNNFVLFRWIRLFLVYLLIIPVKIYQWIISPALPRTCRYVPTCSEYAIEALKVHGPLKGLIIGTRRILSCHPWGGEGMDPVPPQGTSLYTIFKPGKNEK